MTEEKFIKTVSWLLFTASAFLFYGLTYYVTDRAIPEETDPSYSDQFTPKDFGTAPTEAWWTEDTRLEMSEVEEKWIAPVVTYKEMELTSLGTYYITAYCPSECGYNGHNYPTGWMTASDTICHRASHEYRLSEPTTCAISRKVHKFGQVFYIKEFDRTFVAEDTGSAVKGKHLDLFYEEYSDVCSFPTGYYEVFAVEWVDVARPVTEDEYRELKKMGALEFFIERKEEEYEST
jgi:3D (Asp-Asp-Asp) domain-containing protein